MDHHELYPNSVKYQPVHDGREWETESDYVKRMRSTILPNWPNELLKEWLYWHAPRIEKYVFLRFENFTFTLEVWSTDQIPGREVFDDESFCDNFQNISERAKNRDDWLAHYMLREGTWNIPVVILDNLSGLFRFPNGKLLKTPYHVLEGHRRLSFLNGLKELGKVKPEHKVWHVKIEKGSLTT